MFTGTLKVLGVLLVAACLPVAVQAQSPTPSATPGYGCSFEEGLDYQGNDITNRAATSADACALLCLQTANCVAYTWVYSQFGNVQNKCWLKNSIAGRKLQESYQVLISGRCPAVSLSPSVTPSLSPSISRSMPPSVSSSPSPSPSPSASVSVTISPGASASQTPSGTPAASATASASQSAPPTPSPSTSVPPSASSTPQASSGTSKVDGSSENLYVVPQSVVIGAAVGSTLAFLVLVGLSVLLWCFCFVRPNTKAGTPSLNTKAGHGADAGPAVKSSFPHGDV